MFDKEYNEFLKREHDFHQSLFEELIPQLRQYNIEAGITRPAWPRPDCKDDSLVFQHGDDKLCKIQAQLHEPGLFSTDKVIYSPLARISVNRGEFSLSPSFVRKMSWDLSWAGVKEIANSLRGGFEMEFTLTVVNQAQIFLSWLAPLIAAKSQDPTRIIDEPPEPLNPADLMNEDRSIKSFPMPASEVPTYFYTTEAAKIENEAWNKVPRRRRRVS